MWMLKMGQRNESVVSEISKIINTDPILFIYFELFGTGGGGDQKSRVVQKQGRGYYN